MSRRFKRGLASKRHHWRDLRLTLEHLEPRQLLAGLNVWVVSDQNGSRNFDEQVDTSAANRLVYVDLDRDSFPDSDEPFAATNRDGLATFNDLPPGTYQVAIVGTNSAQVQAFPIAPATTGQQRNSSNAVTVLSSHDLSRTWSVSDDGMVSVLDTNRRLEHQFALGGTLESYVQPIGDVAWGLIQNTESTALRLVRLDLEEGAVREIPVDGIGVGSELIELSRVGEQLIVGFSTPRGPRVANLNVTDTGMKIGNAIPAIFDSALAGSPAGSWLATASSVSATKSKVALSDISTGGTVGSTIVLNGQVGGLHFSSDGKLLLATMVGGGTFVLRVGSSLELEAELAEANEPVSINSIDGRVVTGNVSQSNELIVWNPHSWQPAGRIALRAAGSNGLPIAKSAVTDRMGDRLLVATTRGTFEVDLAVPSAAQAVVGDRQDTNVRLGVRVIGANTPPVSSGRANRDVREDSLDDSGSNEFVEFVRDQDGNPLWYTLDTAPRHGRLSLSPDGNWNYQPVEDFFGSDQAVLQVHDGMASSNLTVSINVTGVNDPPSGIQTDFAEIAETASEGSSLGFITIFDPDQDAQYIFTTSDSRFIVVDGQLMLQSPGALDFESESSIVVDVTATDVSRPDFSIVQRTTITVSDVNEPPTGIRISNSQVSENELGAVIGAITLDDPDEVDSVLYELSDDRFEIADGQLQLRDDVELDYESEPSIELVVTTTPQNSPASPVTTTITITVANPNDPPPKIILSAYSVRENSPGYVVGTLKVQVEDAGNRIQFALSDPRFEVVNQRLKLKDNQIIARGEGPEIFLMISATIQNGDIVDENIVLQVEANASSNNPLDRLDVNNDGEVTPQDALILINFLNEFGPQVIDPDQGNGEGTGDEQESYDVNGDGAITPIDVLIIINYLNNAASFRLSGEGEGLRVTQVEAPLSPAIKTRPVTDHHAHTSSVPIVESPAGMVKDSERTTADSDEQQLSVDLPSLPLHSYSTRSSAVQPLYGPIQPGPVSNSNPNRNVNELDSELEFLLDELSLEQFGRLQGE